MIQIENAEQSLSESKERDERNDTSLGTPDVLVQMNVNVSNAIRTNNRNAQNIFLGEQLVYNPFLKMSQLHVMLCYVTRFVVLTEPINAWPRLTAKLNYYVHATVRISTIFKKLKGPFVGLTLEVFRHNRVECCCSRYNFFLTRKSVNCVSIEGAINC